MSQRSGEDRAFLQAIRESPEDDAPRLVYADWLEEHDDLARATFIRVQCELAQQPAKERRAELVAQEHTLLAANRDAWLGPLAKELLYDRCTFRRGFPLDLTVRPTIMVKLAEEFNARVPLGRVTLCGGYGERAMKALADSPSLDWVGALKCQRPLVTEAGLEIIGKSPHLPRLDELSIQFADFTLKGLVALTTSTHRTALRSLSLSRLSWNGTTPPDIVAALAAPEMCLRLGSLSLQGYDIGSSGAAVLAGTKSLAEVKELDLLLNNLGGEGAIALARSPYLRGLTSLTLQSNGLTNRSVWELANSQILEGVRYLNLGVNDVGDEGAEALAASSRLRALRQLDLYSARIGDRGAEALAASTHLTNLKALVLLGNTITDRGSQALFDSPYLQGLERICIKWQNGGATTISKRQRNQWKKRLGKGAQV